MFENQTFENILQRMLSNISDEIDKREGSVAYDMLSPKAAELAMAYIELDNALKFGFAGTTYGEFLDLKVAEAGITRLPASYSKGTVTLTKTIEEVLDVPVGTVVYTETGIRFEVDSTVSITDDNPVQVNITAVNPGVSGNVPANSIINIELADVEVINPSPTTGGAEVESDVLLLDRYYKKVQAPGVSGNKNQYLQWSMSIAGIGNAKVIPLWNGPNTVKVILIDSNKQVVAQGKVDEVANYIEEVRPIGAIVTVESAVNKTIDISATLTLQEGVLIEDVQPKIEADIVKYLKDATFVDPDVKLSKIGTIILGTEGVVDYSNLTLNLGTANIILANNEIPVLGTVTLV